MPVQQGGPLDQGQVVKTTENRIGKLVTDDADSYRYLSESIRMHPDQEELKAMMERSGLEQVEYFNMALGVVALHRGFKF